MMNKQRSQSPPIPQTGFVKILHSLIIISLLLMMTSGLQIYNATPVFGGKTGWQVPKWATLGGWLAGGRDWHFTVMWVFSFTLLIYGIYIFLTHAVPHTFNHYTTPALAISLILFVLRGFQ